MKFRAWQCLVTFLGLVGLLAILAMQLIELRLEKRALLRQALPAIASQDVSSRMRACP